VLLRVCLPIRTAVLLSHTENKVIYRLRVKEITKGQDHLYRALNFNVKVEGKKVKQPFYLKTY